MQPIASDDVADVMAEVALAAPVNGTIEIGGPQKIRLNEIVAHYLKTINDPRQVVADPHATYFGVELDDGSLVPGSKARLGKIRFDDWLSQQPPQKKSA